MARVTTGLVWAFGICKLGLFEVRHECEFDCCSSKINAKTAC
jgi:hypothetical protein